MDAFAIDHARLWIGDGSEFDGHIAIRDGVITAVEKGRYSGPLPVVDLAGCPLSPGMIDLMMLGGFGCSILRDDPIDIARRYLRFGVTGVQFSGGMLSWDMLQQLADRMSNAMHAASDEVDASRIHGIYLEGPFELPECAGAALRVNAQAPTPHNVARLLTMFGPALRMINVSPGTEGDVEAVRQLTVAGKVVTMAHSNAGADRVLACVEAGTQGIGHIWNNNSGLLGDSGVQQPTLEQVALVDDRVRFIHLICDGVHVHPVLVQLVLRARGIEAVCLVTDANQRAGCPDGPFTRDDGQAFYKEDGVCRTAAGHLAGSATLLPEMFRRFVAFTDLPPARAIRAVTLNPAAALGVDEQVGRLAPGHHADVVAWDGQLRVQRIWRAGREVEAVDREATQTV